MQAPHVFLIQYNHRRRESLLIRTIDIHHPHLWITDAPLHAGVSYSGPVRRLNRSKISTLRPERQLALVPTICLHDQNLYSVTAEIRAK